MPTLKINSTQQKIKVGQHKGEKMYVMKVDHYSTKKAKDIIDYAAETCYVPKSQLYSAWEALGTVISTWALEGHIVEIPGLGNIRAEVRAKAQKKVQDITLDDIFRRKLILTPNKTLKNDLKSTKFIITCYNQKGEIVKRTGNDDEQDKA